MIGPLVAIYAAWGAFRCGQHWNASEPGSANEPWLDVILGCLGALLFGPLIDVGNWLARACSR